MLSDVEINISNNEVSNTLFPNCFKPLFQSEAKCKAIDMKRIFHSHANKTHYHKNGFTLGLVVKVRVFGIIIIIIIIIIIVIIITNTFLYGAFTKLNAPYNDLQTEDKIKIPI